MQEPRAPAGPGCGHAGAPVEPAGHLGELVEIAGVRIDVSAIDPSVVEFMRAGAYEAGELRALATALRPGDVVMELGTGIGLLSTYCAQRVGSGRVFTFEANPELEPLIRETFRLNAVAPTLEMCLLGERPGEAEFFVHQAFWGSTAVDRAGAARSVRVPVRPLNEAIARIRPSLLVMDIEGAEAALLRFIDLSGVDRIVAEFHERMLGREAADAMIEGLYRQGFVIVRGDSQWEVCSLERAEAVDPARHVPLQEFRCGPWRLGDHWAAPCFDELMAIVPPGTTYAAVDEDQWGSVQLLPARRRVPFIESEGRFWGAPGDGGQAVQALRRQRDQGLQMILFAASCAWWLRQYPALNEELQTRHRLLAASEHFRAYALR
jgi:FkbM family methyltransferase